MAIARYGFEPKHGYRNDDSDESDTESDEDSEFDTHYNKFKHKFDLKNSGNNANQRNMSSKKLSDNYKWWLKENNLIQLGQKELEYQREPRWPVEMQVLPDKIKHIQGISNESEPFYVKSRIFLF
jgi:hypothetical protein